MRSVRVLGLALAAGLLASQAHAGVPAGAAFTSACAGLGFGGGGVAIDDVALLTTGSAHCANQTSVVGGSASSSAANSGTSGGVAFTNAASSSAGPKAIHLNATNSSAVQSAFAAGMANGGFTEQIGITGGTGTGVWVFPIAVKGTLDATGFGADATLNVAAYQNGLGVGASAPTPGSDVADAIFLALNSPIDRGAITGSSTDLENVAWNAEDRGPTSSLTLQHLAVDDTIWFAVPITFGTSFDLGIFANVRAGEISSGAGTDPESTDLDFHSTIFWGGPGYVITDGGTGPITPDFKITTGTGTDLSTPFSEGVPEPAEWTLLLLGFFGLGGVARSRKTEPA
jgi:hypothetical protein